MAMTLRLDEGTRVSMHALIQRAVDRELARHEKSTLVASVVDDIRTEDCDLLDRLGR